MLINRQDWPPTGPHRALLDFLDQIHREHGSKSFDRLHLDMSRISRAPGLAPSRIHAILRGRSLPINEDQTRLIVFAMIGTDDPAAVAEAGKAAQLFVEAEQARRDAPRPTAEFEPPATPAPVAEQTPPRHGHRRRTVLLACAGALLAAVIAVAWVLLPGDVTALDIGVTDEGISCAPLADPAVRIVEIAADDGRAGIAKYNTITVAVLRPNRTGHTYWLLAHVFEVGDVGPYIAKQQVYDDIGPRTYGLQLDSQVDSVREVFVVEADPDGTAVLRRNSQLPMDGSQDADAVRASRPAVATVSATCRVTKTRDQP